MPMPEWTWGNYGFTVFTGVSLLADGGFEVNLGLEREGMKVLVGLTPERAEGLARELLSIVEAGTYDRALRVFLELEERWSPAHAQATVEHFMLWRQQMAENDVEVHRPGDEEEE